MKKSFIIFLGFLFIASSFITAQSLEEILKTNYESRGGLKKLQDIKSLFMKIKMPNPATNQEMTADIWVKGIDKMRMEMEMMQKKLTMGFYGDEAWWINPFFSPDPKKMPDMQADSMRNNFDMLDPLVDYKKYGHKLEYIGKQDMEGSEVYKVKHTKKNGKITFIYLDLDSCITIKTSSYQKVQDKEILIESFPSNYKPVEGVIMPFAITIKTQGSNQPVQLTILEYKLNPNPKDSFFKRPEVKKEDKK